VFYFHLHHSVSTGNMAKTLEQLVWSYHMEILHGKLSLRQEKNFIFSLYVMNRTFCLYYPEIIIFKCSI